MDKWLHNDFEAGQEDTYILDAEDVGELLLIKLHNDQGGLFADWFVERVMITCSQDPQRLYEFPCGRWVQSESIFYEGKGRHCFKKIVPCRETLLFSVVSTIIDQWQT